MWPRRAEGRGSPFKPTAHGSRTARCVTWVPTCQQRNLSTPKKTIEWSRMPNVRDMDGWVDAVAVSAVGGAAGPATRTQHARHCARANQPGNVGEGTQIADGAASDRERSRAVVAQGCRWGGVRTEPFGEFPWRRCVMGRCCGIYATALPASAIFFSRVTLCIDHDSLRVGSPLWTGTALPSAP